MMIFAKERKRKWQLRFKYSILKTFFSKFFLKFWFDHKKLECFSQASLIFSGKAIAYPV